MKRKKPEPVNLAETNKARTQSGFRPKETPSNNADLEDLNDMPDSEFYMKIMDIPAMSQLMYAMCELVGDLRLLATPNGLRLNESMASNNLFVFLEMKASVFEEYHCEKEVVLCFEPSHMYDCISRHTTKPMTMTWTLHRPHKHKKKGQSGEDYPESTSDRYYYNNFQLIVRVEGDDPDSLHSYEYTIPLLKSFKQIYKAKPRRVDYNFALNTPTMRDILTTFSDLQNNIETNWVDLQCLPGDENNKGHIRFAMMGTSGSTVTRATYTIKTTKSKSLMPAKMRPVRKRKHDNDFQGVHETDIERKLVQNPIQVQFHFDYLYLLKRCFAMNSGFMSIYLEKDFPIVFEVKVGTLGDFYAVLMYNDENKET